MNIETLIEKLNETVALGATDVFVDDDCHLTIYNGEKHIETIDESELSR